MKSFTSAILAAAVSANYCYSDGCNCNGETRACYSLPRQNMRPQAINTCCPVGVEPTVYGINNGRSVNIPQTAALYTPNFSNKLDDEEMTCAQTYQASDCSSVAYSQRSACEKARADARKVCEQTSADERIEAEKTAADERVEAEKAAADERVEAEKAAADERVTSSLLASCAQTFQARECAQVFQARGCNKLGLGNARKECEKNAGDVRKECEKDAGDVRKECEKAQTSNLQVYGGGQPNTHLAKLDNFKDCRDYNLYCCQEWNRFEWECLSQGLPSSDQNCKDVVSTAAAAGITADRPGTCTPQYTSLGMCYKFCVQVKN